MPNELSLDAVLLCEDDWDCDCDCDCDCGCDCDCFCLPFGVTICLAFVFSPFLFESLKKLVTPFRPGALA